MAAIKVALCIWNKWSSARVSVTSAERMEPGGETFVEQQTRAGTLHRGSERPRCHVVGSDFTGESKTCLKPRWSHVSVSAMVYGAVSRLWELLLKLQMSERAVGTGGLRVSPGPH